MRKKPIIVALIGTFISSIFLIQAQQRIEFKEFTLDNGLKVILHEDKTTPIVAVNLTYHVGSKNERPDRTGFAHFFEHLMFEGTQNIERGEYMKKIESIGGTLNAGTSKDYTTYFETVPSNHLETVLYMESERMLHAKIDEIGVSTQRSVIKEEKSQTQDNRPYGTIVKEVFERSHQKHPYNWTIIGETEHLAAATLEEFMGFYDTYYVPNNAVLAIAGDIDYVTAEAAVRKYFEEIPRGTREIVRPNVMEPKRNAEIRDIIYDNIQLPAVVQSFNLPTMTDQDIPAIELLSTYLSGGKSALLTKEIVDKQQKALAVISLPYILEDGGVFLLYGIANLGIDINDLESAINEQIEGVKVNGISTADFEKLKAQVEMNAVNSLGSVTGIAQELSISKIFYGDANEINRKVDKYSEVTKEDIQRVAKKYLDENGRVALHYLPQPAEAQ